MSKYADRCTFTRTEEVEHDGISVTLTEAEATKFLSVLKHHTSVPGVHKVLVDGVVADLTVALGEMRSARNSAS